jgi:hypothetical protein
VVLKECGLGLGKIALGSLLADAFVSNSRAATGSATDTLKAHGPHFSGKAKRVIICSWPARRASLIF